MKLAGSVRVRLRALGELGGVRELVLFARLCGFAMTVPLLTRLSLPRLAALVVRPAAGPAPPDPSPERLARLVALAPRVAHPLVRPGCLTRGITLFWFLRRRGIDVELRFGLDTSDLAATDGHCWLALDGEPFLEPVDPRPRFAETYRLPLRTT